MCVFVCVCAPCLCGGVLRGGRGARGRPAVRAICHHINMSKDTQTQTDTQTDRQGDQQMGRQMQKAIREQCFLCRTRRHYDTNTCLQTLIAVSTEAGVGDVHTVASV